MSEAPIQVMRHLAQIDQNLAGFRLAVLELSAKTNLFAKLLRDLLSMTDPNTPTTTPVMAFSANCTVENILKVVFENWDEIAPNTRALLAILYAVEDSNESLEETKAKLRSLLFPPPQ